jgi:hypothetical protein
MVVLVKPRPSAPSPAAGRTAPDRTVHTAGTDHSDGALICSRDQGAGSPVAGRLDLADDSAFEELHLDGLADGSSAVGQRCPGGFSYASMLTVARSTRLKTVYRSRPPNSNEITTAAIASRW